MAWWGFAQGARNAHIPPRATVVFVINNLRRAGAQQSLVNLLTHATWASSVVLLLLQSAYDEKHMEALHASGVTVVQADVQEPRSRTVTEALDLVAAMWPMSVVFWNVEPIVKTQLARCLGSWLRFVDVSPGEMLFDEFSLEENAGYPVPLTLGEYIDSLSAFVTKYAKGYLSKGGQTDRAPGGQTDRVFGVISIAAKSANVVTPSGRPN